MFPKHIACVPNSRKALAPYNFVELPDKIVEAQPLPEGDRYHRDRCTGKIECTLTTESPLYTRCGWSPTDFAQYGDKAFHELPNEIQQKRANFFINPVTQQPMIPGSSLRGMLRTLVEIISFSKIHNVADSQLIYRAVGDTTSLGEKYRERLLKNLRNNEYIFLMQAGYMIQTTSGGWKIRPARKLVQNTSFARIEEGDIPNDLNKWKNSENAYSISVSVDPIKPFPHNHGRVKLHYAKAKPREGGKENGVLVKTGSAPRKHMQFVFGLPESHDKSDIAIPNELIEEYKNQITEGQKKILGAEGVLLSEQPVFYLIEENQLVFFGHAMMFRLPYKSSVRNFIPQLRNSEKPEDFEITDFAEAIFGYVRDQKCEKEQVRGGRVFLTDAICVNFEQEQTTSPKILGSPKPTTFQHYLVQPEEAKADPKQLKHYASESVQETVLRGHKLYWHKRNVSLSQIRELDIGKINKSKSQYTKIKPLKSGSSFRFSIYFENLSKIEIGALLWVLDLAQDEKYRLSLGMGKPLGMGAVKITHQLYLNQRKNRYEGLFSDDQWLTGYSAQADSAQPYIDAFDDFIRKEIGATESSLKEVRRIKMLLAMLSWDEAPSPDQTRYLEIECDPTKTACISQPKQSKNTANEYAARPVLPTPLQVIGWENCNDKDNNPNRGNSGGGNSPKPNSPKSGKGNSSSSTREKSSSGGTGKTSIAAAFERATQRPKRP